MFFPTHLQARRFLGLVFLLQIPLQNAFSAPQGSVDVALEWGSSAHAYTYVFSGVATCRNHPCANANVELDLETATQGVIVQTTRAGEDGRYQLEVTLRGAPADSSTWKLEAHSAAVSDAETAEAEGSLILTEDQTTVVVERPLRLIQA